ncbi:sensor histidine kinase [Nocardia crassostreae]|uniref:sensor histidine kinase n=1 Tax=Nocardia crassostreae TaxID=53428 RepID=UPI0014716D66|nr:histidine kinase [Nocardia crassostreae]
MKSIAARVLEAWPIRLAPWQTLLLTTVAAVAAAAVVFATLLAATDISAAGAVVLAVVQGAAVFVATRSPYPGWALSLVALSAASILTDTKVELWVDPVLNSHFIVLGIGAIRATARAAAITWAATVATALAFALYLRPTECPMGVAGSALVSGLVLSTVVAVRALAATSTSLRRERDSTERQRQLTALWEERARIARELHDVVAHHMTVIAIQAEAAQHRDPAIAPETKARLATIRTSATDALGEMRHILGVLRTGDTTLLPQPTLPDIPDLIASVRAGGTPIDLKITGDTSTVPATAGLSSYRIVQEALSNAIRHAPGSPVNIDITITPHLVRIHVANPHTPSPTATPGSGHGLLGMRERVTMLGGTLEAGSNGNGKYTVTAALPIRGGDFPELRK